ncbi:MAG: DUF6062 family protein [bacterium]|nr:DUF6062 family protein [bacterium]
MNIKSNTYYELLDAMKERGCPVCLLLETYTDKYIDNLLYESVNDTNLRGRLIDSGGFCKEHSKKLLRFGYRGYALGISIIYKDLMDAYYKTLNTQGTLSSNRKCLICEVLEDVEGRILEELVKNIKERNFYQIYRDSEGLCMFHLSKVLTLSKDREISEIFLELTALKLKELSSQLSEFIRKQDYRFREEPIGIEADSWIRAIEILRLK